MQAACRQEAERRPGLKTARLESGQLRALTLGPVCCFALISSLLLTVLWLILMCWCRKWYCITVFSHLKFVYNTVNFFG